MRPSYYLRDDLKFLRYYNGSEEYSRPMHGKLLPDSWTLISLPLLSPALESPNYYIVPDLVAILAMGLNPLHDIGE